MELAHGERRTYKSGCRCVSCRAANAAYRAARRRARPPALAFVNAAEARGYLQQLRALGIGCRQVARLAGVPLAVVRRVRNGRQRRVKAATATALLAVRPVLARGQHVAGWPTWRLLHSLEAEGFTHAEIAAAVGLPTPKVQFHHDRVTVRTALRVRRLYEAVTADELEPERE